MTAQGHPRVIFKRAIERGNLVVAEMAARELGRISLDESLAFTALAVQKAPERRSRCTIRWLRRLLEEDENLTVEEAAPGRSRSRRPRWPRAGRGAVDASGHGRTGD